MLGCVCELCCVVWMWIMGLSYGVIFAGCNVEVSFMLWVACDKDSLESNWEFGDWFLDCSNQFSHTMLNGIGIVYDLWNLNWMCVLY